MCRALILNYVQSPSGPLQSLLSPEEVDGGFGVVCPYLSTERRKRRYRI